MIGKGKQVQMMFEGFLINIYYIFTHPSSFSGCLVCTYLGMDGLSINFGVLLDSLE